jgi:hypothetical protein
MAEKTRKAARASDHSATVGYDAQLWEVADAVRGSMDAAECQPNPELANSRGRP